MTGPLFSIVVPTYGRPQFLSEALASVLAQTVDDFECIVVDDAGSGTVAIPSDPRFRFVRRDKNGGPAAARNTGIEESRGRYVTFLDDDDVYASDRLEMAAEGLGRAPVALCWLAFIDGERGQRRMLEGDVHDRILDSLTPHVGRAAAERSIVPRFDESLSGGGEDAEWWLRLSAGTLVTTVPRFGYFFRRHDSPRFTTQTEALAKSRVRLLAMHPDYFATHDRARAFNWSRVGLLAARAGDHRLARTAFLRSLRAEPRLRTAWHLAESVRPSRATIRLPR